MATRVFATRYLSNISSLNRFTFTNFARNYPKVIGKVDSFSAESIQTGELNEFTKRVGDWVEEGEIIARIETEKTTLDFNSTASGVLTKTLSNPGDTLKIGSELYEIDTDAPRPAKAEKAEPKAEKAAESKSDKAAEAKTEKAPKAEKETKKEESKPTHSATITSSQQPPAGVHSAGRETRVKMTLIRRRIAERLKLSQNTAALLTTFQECDMHNLMELRNEYKDQFLAAHGVKLGFMSGFVKASATALLEHRLVNAYIDESDIVYRDYVDISVAVATPKGLVTPVLRDCDKMTFADIEKEIVAYGTKGRNGQLTPNDITGGTFTISNGGVYGSLMGTPIVNPPQSAILGMHAIVPRPVVINNQITIRPMMYLALTYDHRLLDGKDAVTFLKSIKEKVEDPRRLLLGL